MSLKSYKYRLYPTREQQERLQWTLNRCRELYNASVQERREAYHMVHKSITYYDQASQLPEIKSVRDPRYFRQAEKKLAKQQQALARKKKGSNRRKKAAKLVAKTHRKIRNQRRDFLHKQSRKLVNQ